MGKHKEKSKEFPTWAASGSCGLETKPSAKQRLKLIRRLYNLIDCREKREAKPDRSEIGIIEGPRRREECRGDFGHWGLLLRIMPDGGRRAHDGAEWQLCPLSVGERGPQARQRRCSPRVISRSPAIKPSSPPPARPPESAAATEIDVLFPPSRPQSGNGGAATHSPRPALMLPRPSPPRRPLQDSQAGRCAPFLQLSSLFLLLDFSLAWDTLSLRFEWIWISARLIALLVRPSWLLWIMVLLGRYWLVTI